MPHRPCYFWIGTHPINCATPTLEFIQFVINLIIWNVVKHYLWNWAEHVTCLASLGSVVYCHIYHRRLIQPCQYYLFIPQSALRQAYSLFRNYISTKGDLVLPKLHIHKGRSGASETTFPQRAIWCFRNYISTKGDLVLPKLHLHKERSGASETTSPQRAIWCFRNYISTKGDLVLPKLHLHKGRSGASETKSPQRAI